MLTVAWRGEKKSCTTGFQRALLYQTQNHHVKIKTKQIRGKKSPMPNQCQRLKSEKASQDLLKNCCVRKADGHPDAPYLMYTQRQNA